MIILKVLTFCGAVAMLTAAAGIITKYLITYHPQIIRRILGE